MIRVLSIAALVVAALACGGAAPPPPVAPVAPQPPAEPPAVWVELGSGAYHSCARDSSSRVWCWGSGGALGLDEDALAPRVVLERAADLDVREHGVCAHVAGELQCVGVTVERDAEEEQRFLTVRGRREAEQRSLYGWQMHCVLDGDVHCVGYPLGAPVDESEQPAEPRSDDNEDAPPPERDMGMEGATSLALGWTHACALDAQAQVRCWGNGAQGQLGNGTRQYQGSPHALARDTEALSGASARP